MATRHASAAAGAPAELSRAYLYDALGRRVRETGTDASGALTGATAWVYDGEHIAYEQNLRLDGTGSEVASYVSILCALPQAPAPCRIATRWYTHSDATDDVLAATPDMASAAPGTPRSPTVDAGAVSAGLPSPSASSFSYHADHQGSVRAVTDDTGQIVNAYSYDAYGNAEEAVEALAQPFRFTGREYDPVTGLYHYRARAYDAATGRFLQEDPIWFEAGDLNVYRYTWNNPTNWNDPSGMAAAAERSLQDQITTRLLLAGRTARRLALSTGAKTARYLRSFDKNKLSAIAAQIACTYFILADAVAQSGPNTEIVGIDRSRCGVVAMSVADDDAEVFPIPDTQSPDWCQWIKKECIRECSEMALPTRENSGDPFFRCVKQCMHDNDCPGHDYGEGWWSRLRIGPKPWRGWRF